MNFSWYDLKTFNDFEMLITRAGDVLRGSNGHRWKAVTLSFPTTPWLTYFDLKTSSYGLFELGSFCVAFGGKFIEFIKLRQKGHFLSMKMAKWDNIL